MDAGSGAGVMGERRGRLDEGGGFTNYDFLGVLVFGPDVPFSPNPMIG